MKRTTYRLVRQGQYLVLAVAALVLAVAAYESGAALSVALGLIAFLVALVGIVAVTE